MARKENKRRNDGTPRATNADRKSDRLMERLRAFIRTRGRAFLRDPNINSIGIGYKVTGGEVTDQLCLQFTVDEKVKGTTLESMVLEKGTTKIPESIAIGGGITVRTDVIQRRFRTSLHLVRPQSAAKSQRKRRVDPLVPGVSVSHWRGTAGTLGLIPPCQRA